MSSYWHISINETELYLVGNSQVNNIIEFLNKENYKCMLPDAILFLITRKQYTLYQIIHKVHILEFSYLVTSARVYNGNAIMKLLCDSLRFALSPHLVFALIFQYVCIYKHVDIDIL